MTTSLHAKQNCEHKPMCDKTSTKEIDRFEKIQACQGEGRVTDEPTHQ